MATIELTLADQPFSLDLKSPANTSTVVTEVVDDEHEDKESANHSHRKTPSHNSTVVTRRFSNAGPKAPVNVVEADVVDNGVDDGQLDHALPSLVSPLSTVRAAQILNIPATVLGCATESGTYRLSLEILDVLEKYGRHLKCKPVLDQSTIEMETKTPAWIGKDKFLPHVSHYVRQAQPVQLTLPAFPCKSLNRKNKVLGHLPDLGEELALGRLHAMGMDIGKVYPPGAQVNIASDGVLFNDILGISDEDCWDYGEELNAIMSEKGLSTLRFTRCMSLLGHLKEESIDRESYLASTKSCRQDLEGRFAPSDEALTELIKTDKDTILTYRGMAKFLESEMETSPTLAGQSRSARKRVQEKLAKRMMQRSEAFTLAIRTLCPLHVRLSMHPSSGAAKLSIPLVPTSDGNFQRSPWHSCIAAGRDNSFRCVHVEEVRHSHDLVYRYGRPYYYRERD
ncbi:MAG: hypothetical protein Q9226_005055 [Calogaya cf. arnoldii]